MVTRQAHAKPGCAALLWMLCLAAPPLTQPAYAQASRPAPFEVYEKGAFELQAAMASGTVTSAQLVQSYLARIAAFDQAGPALNAILQLNPQAISDAEALDQERALQGPRGPLHGIPVLVKDNFDVAGLPTTGGSVALQDLVPQEDSWLVARMRDAGAIVLAKTNMHEFAFGITTTSSLGGQTRNPYDLTRHPGGSSGGTAVGVTASFAPIGWGTDTCGSVRIPAAYNGLVGLRPTQDLLSTSGVLPLARTLDTPGPMARRAMDLALAMDAVLGSGGRGRPEQASDLASHLFVSALQDDALVGVRIGVLGDHLDGTWTIGEVLAELGRSLPSGTSVAPADLLRATSEGSVEGLEVGQAARVALERMEGMGAELVEIGLGDMDDFLAGEEIIDMEFGRDLQAYLLAKPAAPLRSLDDILRLGVHDPSIEDVLIRRSKAASASPVEYRDALARLAATREKLLRVFERDRLDAIAYPTMRRPPAEIGQNQWGSMCLLSTSTGFPAITIPVGLGPGGLPVGLELLARPGDDARLVAFAHAFEKAHEPRVAPGTTPPLPHGTP